MSQIVIRIQSRNGTKRVHTTPSTTLKSFLQQVSQEFEQPFGTWHLYRERNRVGEITSSTKRTLSSQNIRHGDMLFLLEMPAASTSSSNASMSSSAASVSSYPDKAGMPTSVQTSQTDIVVEDDIDVFLAKQDGLVHRDRDPQFCHHGPKSKCIHCFPYEPYDERYLKKVDPPIKHMSFHAYLKKLTHGDKGKFAVLDDISCKIRDGCKEHAPWPAGICTKCQPSAITLKRQEYRHVDYIMYENPGIVEEFLNFWRKTGSQRVGFLYGYYDQHKDVPLGIKAVVVAIYEPPQVGTRDSIELLPDPHTGVVDKVASDLGLRRVGWIFTDLVPEDMRQGTVKHLRDMNTYFLSAEECIMAGYLQNLHPSPSKLSFDGKFGSKFVSVCVSGNLENHIGFDGYQVSNQCMALVRDNCLVPTKDEPGLGYVRESSSGQYVPDVFYKDKDSYGNEVTLLARPMPMEYFLIQMAVGFPIETQSFFPGGKGAKFPIENRSQLGEIQDFNALMSYMSQQTDEDFLNAMSDIHLLIFLASFDLLPFKEHLPALCTAIKNKDKDLAFHWKHTDAWATLEQMMHAHAPSPEPGATFDDTMDFMETRPSQIANGPWTCTTCTYINLPGKPMCDMCSSPKS